MNAAVETMKLNVRKAIREARKAGTVGMSFACLKANTPTRGLTCSVEDYHAAFEVAVREVCKGLRSFRVY